MPSIFMTGTTSGIGAEMFKILSTSDNTIICGNRTSENPLDMSSMTSIDAFVESNKSKEFDVVILNAGIKATRKLVEWNGKQMNQCRVVNLVANNYILQEMTKRNMLTKNAKLVFVSSITHWNAVDNPNNGLDADPTNVEWANQQYSNTKLGLFFLGRRMKRLNPNYDVIIINPGMVATKIFGDKNADGLIPTTMRNVREFLSFTPSESADYMVKAILSKPTDMTKEFRYFTPHQTLGIFGYCDKTQMLQDVLGKRLLYRCESDTDNFSKRALDADIEANYSSYMTA